MLTDRRWDLTDYPSPHPIEYERDLVMRRESFTFDYEVGRRAFIWAVGENRDHKWDFIVSWHKEER